MVAGLAFLWLLLNQTVAPGHVVLALVIAVSLSWLASTLRPLAARVRNPQVIVVLLATVLVDVVRSNVAVGLIVLGLVRGREVKSGFLEIPLELRDPHGLASLAMIVTATPGTVWVDLARDGSRVTLHILDLADEERWINWIKNRYEQPLRRIFE
jgi:multicomponent K+:H+ antiporter subunit E